MNRRGIWAIYAFEMARWKRTLWQSLFAPVLTTTLYFVVFGAAIGERMSDVDGVPYGAFIVPGLMMLTIFTQSLSNASFGIYFPQFSGTIYEILSAPLSPVETLTGYVGAAASKSILIGLVILGTGSLFVDLHIQHPIAMLFYLVLMALTFSLLGFIVGIWAQSFEQLQFFPLLVATPLTFLGGAFYAIDMLPPFWQSVTLLNPFVYLISGFRWCFYGQGDVDIVISLLFCGILLGLGLLLVGWIFRSGYRLKQ